MSDCPSTMFQNRSTPEALTCNCSHPQIISNPKSFADMYEQGSLALEFDSTLAAAVLRSVLFLPPQGSLILIGDLLLSSGARRRYLGSKVALSAPMVRP